MTMRSFPDQQWPVRHVNEGIDRAWQQPTDVDFREAPRLPGQPVPVTPERDAMRNLNDSTVPAERPRRCILHVDMDAFFVAVELRRHPELKGQPVIVGGRGDPSERGVVSTASYEARRFGVHSGMPLRTALRLCPQARFLPLDYETYSAVSGQIKRILAEFTPVMEDAGIDEAFLDISATPGSPMDIARAIKRRIREETELSCSIGIASNKLLAKMASDLEKPDGLTLIGAGDIERRLWPLAVRKLWGVGPKTEQRLARLGIATIGELARAPARTLVVHLGTAHGQFLAQAARGIDDSPLVTHWEPKSLSHETTFQRDTGDRVRIRNTLRTLTRELVAELRDQGYAARAVAVKLRFADFESHTHTVTMAGPTDDPEAIEHAALQCLRRFALVKKVRLVGVRLGGLSHAHAETAPCASTN
jgi:DNA polymerase-4